MSYSFTIRAANKADAKAAVSDELSKVLDQQPIHSVDHPEAQAAADAFIDLLPDDDSQVVQVSVNGSVGWNGPEEEPTITSVAVGVNASLMPKG